MSFIGALAVVWVPCLSAIFDGQRLGLASAPQVWLAAVLTLSGVGLLELGPLELGGSMEAFGLAPGDAWAVVQSVGFAASFYCIGRYLAEEDDESTSEGGSSSSSLNDQVLAVTAVNIACVAAFAACWAVLDGCGIGPLANSPSAGWLLDPSTRAAYALPGALFGPLGVAFAWSGLATTALVRVGESTGLSKVA